MQKALARHLRHDEGLTYREIGVQCGVSLSTVHRWLNGPLVYTLPCKTRGCDAPINQRFKSPYCAKCKAARSISAAFLRLASTHCRACGDELGDLGYYCGFCDISGRKSLDAARTRL